MSVSTKLEDSINTSFEELPEKIKNLLPDYDKALNSASDYNQQLVVVRKYLLDNLSDLIPDLDSCIDILTHIFEELGCNESDNPFISFIKYVAGKNISSILSKDNLILLNNWFADDLIDFNDISGFSEERNNHPIFQTNLYKSSDPETILKSYEFLSSLGNIQRLNLDAIRQSKKIDKDDMIVSMAEKYKDVKTIKDYKALNEIRMAFINGTDDFRTFRDVNDLKSLLTIAARETSKGNSDNYKQALDNTSKLYKNLSKEDKLSYLKQLIKLAKNDDIDIELRS